MARFYLILATYGRRKEIYNFLESLKNGKFSDFELIVVDQNDVLNIDDIIKYYKNFFEIHHIKMKEKGLSKARNVALKFIKDNIRLDEEIIVGFPDDDCEYPPHLLEVVKSTFEERKEYQILTGVSIDKKSGSFSVGKFKTNSCEINSRNLFQTAISFTIFVKFKTKNDIIYFDEKLGLGSFFSSSEETDYLYSLLKKGYRGLYLPEKIYVYHPQKGLNFKNQEDQERAYKYSLGMGAFYKKHLIEGKDLSLIISFIRYFFIRPIGAMLLGAVRLNIPMFKFYKNILVGRWKGFIKYRV